MQQAYIDALYDLAETDERVVSLLSDSGTEYDEYFMRDFPKQCFNFGIAEQVLVGAAAGMASCGKIPFVYTSGAFIAYRALEFLRDCVCLQNENVKLIGVGSGLSWSTLGPTHHTTEDIGVLRSMPNLTILSPATPLELQECVKLAYSHKGPVYIRIGLKNEEEFHQAAPSIVLGKNNTLINGTQAIVFSTGSITSEAKKACEKLNSEGFSIELQNVVSIKPFDENSVKEAVNNFKNIITVEEHNVIGGLGSIVCDVISQCIANKELRQLKIGLQDCFAKGYGTQNEVRESNGLDAESICKKIKLFLAVQV